MSLIIAKDAKNCNSRKRAACIFALISGVICAVIYCLAMAFEFEAASKLFKRDAVFSTVYEILCVLSSFAVVIICGFFVPKKSESESLYSDEESDFYFRKDCAPVKAARYAAAALIFTASLADFIVIFSNPRGQVLPPVLEIARLLAAFALVLYFLPEVSDMIEDFFGKVHLYCGLFGLLWFFFTVLRDYFRMDIPIAAHYRILGHIALIVCMVALLFELKLKTGVHAIKRRLAFLSIGFILGFSFGFGQIVMMILGKAPSFSNCASAVIVLAVSCYFGIKLAFYSEEC